MFWLRFGCFLLIEAATLIIPIWLTARLYKEDGQTVRLPKSMLYWGLVMIFQGGLYFLVGIGGSVWERGLDQILSWIGLWLGFGLSGTIMIVSTLRKKVQLTASGLSVSYLLRGGLNVPWPDIACIRRHFWQGYLVIERKNGKALRLHETYSNIDVLLEAAEQRQIPVLGFDLDED